MEQHFDHELAYISDIYKDIEIEALNYLEDNLFYPLSPRVGE